MLTIGQGGIVFDSDPYDEWMETINKLGALISTCDDNFPSDSAMERTDRFFIRLGANTHCITSAEEKHLAEQADGEPEETSTALEGDAKTRIAVAA